MKTYHLKKHRIINVNKGTDVIQWDVLDEAGEWHGRFVSEALAQRVLETLQAEEPAKPEVTD